jgi:hypothetical protein
VRRQDAVTAWCRANAETIRHALLGAHVVVREGRRSDFPAARDHARTIYDTRKPRELVIEVAPRMMRTSRRRIEGVLMHEIGHAWWLVRGEVDHSERDADAAARKVFGRTIRYDRTLSVQTTGPGVSPRPRGLPQ